MTTESDLEADLVKARTELSRWQSPAAFIKRVEEIDSLIDSAVLFTKPNINFLFDALVLAEFVKLRRVEQVCLAGAREEWPDGFIGNPKAFENVEITEIMEPGRRRSDEYRPTVHNSEPPPDRPEDWRVQAAKIPAALEAGIKKKVRKNYGVKPILLIYLNMGDYGLMQKQTKAAITELKAKYSESFHEIWVIWQGRLY
jgi:hypothetical protein